jgi:ATP synthase protein I
MTSSDAPRPARPWIPAAEPTASPWLRMLLSCLTVTGILVVLLAAAAAVFAGWSGALSALFGAAVVVAFFSLSLLVGHFVGRRNPSGAIGAFMFTYLVKVVGFAALLIFLGAPAWLDRTWFFVTAVAGVLVWQATEVIVFSRTRHQLFSDPEPTPGNEHG